MGAHSARMNARRTPPAPWQPRPSSSSGIRPLPRRAGFGPHARHRPGRGRVVISLVTGPRPAASSGRLVGRLVRPDRSAGGQRLVLTGWSAPELSATVGHAHPAVAAPSTGARVSLQPARPRPVETQRPGFTTLALLDARRVCVHRDPAQAVPTVGFALDAVAALHQGSRSWREHQDAEATWLVLRQAAIWEPSIARVFDALAIMSLAGRSSRPAGPPGRRRRTDAGRVRGGDGRRRGGNVRMKMTDTTVKRRSRPPTGEASPKVAQQRPRRPGPRPQVPSPAPSPQRSAPPRSPHRNEHSRSPPARCRPARHAVDRPRPLRQRANR